MAPLQDTLRSALADRYRIERQLGEGGMATVFLAHDLKHDRDVAIKVLKPELARTLTGERFLREISITARLNHPHILALLDSGETADGALVYYVMPVATGESLRERLAARGALPLVEALRAASDVTEALAHAHAQGVVHRDIKPENILLSGEHAIVVDCGIAKAVGAARDLALTSEGMSLGTPVYMAPEQAAGDESTDHRADLYAVGVLLYEMLAGVVPFDGSFTQILVDKATKDAPLLSAPVPSAPPALVRLVARCLARDPAARPATADALLSELRALTASAPARATSRLPRIAGGVALAAIAALTLLYVRDRRARWVHETAIPTMSRLIDADQLDSAYALGTRALERAPDDSALVALLDGISLKQSFLSEPAGAEVARASLTDTSHWIPVGTTPTGVVRIPSNAWMYRYTKPGYRPVTLMAARLWGSYVPVPTPVPLRKISDPDSDMVMLHGGRLTATLYGTASTDTFELADFLMDKREVTNRQYKAFVDAGGYSTAKWWDDPILRDGKAVPFTFAAQSFIDRTGRPGPSTWEGGAPAEGTLDLPVGGVSWYEARAYARFAGKALPTLVEWNAAAMPEAARWVVPTGRFESSSPVRGGAPTAVSARGVYDMAGNVREWTVNPREPGTRFILGGGYSDPQYLFAEPYVQPELDRAPINGIRLIRRVADTKDLAGASAPLSDRARSATLAPPADEATYRGYAAMYDYDRTPLNAKVLSRDSSDADWVREDVAFDGVGGAGRIVAVLFLPKRARPPYQTLVIWPASDAFVPHDRKRLSMSFADYLLRSGRAVLYPIYEHTYGRGSPLPVGDVPEPTIAHRDQMLRWVKEMRRSIDYVVTRPEIDPTKLAYLGTSWGGRAAGVSLALEPRFRTALLNVAGLGANARRPEEDPVNFLPRVHIPVLMLSGRFDSVFPLELSQKPFLRLLGSKEKKQVLFDGGHFLPRTTMMSESLQWLDDHLGPVGKP